MLAAWAMGIGSCPITVHDFGFVARTLSLPTDRQCEYLIALGWPADPSEMTRSSRAGGRRPHDEVVHEEGWCGSEREDETGRHLGGPDGGRRDRGGRGDRAPETAACGASEGS